MKRILEILALMPLMFLLNSCEGTELDSNSAAGSKPGGDVELPQPPEQEKTSNVFVVDIFSTLEDDGDFFGIRSIDSAAQHISNQSGKKPLVYMFDSHILLLFLRYTSDSFLYFSNFFLCNFFLFGLKLA